MVFSVILLYCLVKNETKPVQMMYQMHKLPYNYIPDHSLQILELPYVNEELSMFILLPEESKDGSDPLLKVQHCDDDTSALWFQTSYELCCSWRRS